MGPLAFWPAQMTSTSVAALIMAGGRSERMRAGGCGQHKGLRTVLGVPLIQRNLQSLLEHGFQEIYVAVSSREEELGQWLSKRGRALATAKQATLQILVEEPPLGTIGAVGWMPAQVGAAVIVNVDNLSSLDLTKMVDFHQQHRAAATIATHEHAARIPYGALDLDGNRVLGYREKPVLRTSVSSGAYVLGRAAIGRVPAGARLDAPDLINELVRSGETVLAYPHQEPWIDINDEAALIRAESVLFLAPDR